MPHILTQDILAEQMEEYSKALAEDCVLSGIYDKANLYAKKTTDNHYDIMFTAYEPKKDKNQIINSSTRIISKLDEEKLYKTIKTIYKTFISNSTPSAISTNIVDSKIVFIFNTVGEWKIAVDNISQEEQKKLIESLEKVS